MAPATTLHKCKLWLEPPPYINVVMDWSISYGVTVIERTITPRNAFASKNKWTIFPYNCNITAEFLRQLTTDVCVCNQRWPQDDQADLDHLSHVWVSPPEGPTTTTTTSTQCTICKLAVWAKTSPRAPGHILRAAQFLCLGFALFIHHNCEMFISMCKLGQKIFLSFLKLR